MDDSTRNVRLFSHETFPHFEAIFFIDFTRKHVLKPAKMAESTKRANCSAAVQTSMQRNW